MYKENIKSVMDIFEGKESFTPDIVRVLNKYKNNMKFEIIVCEGDFLLSLLL